MWLYGVYFFIANYSWMAESLVRPLELWTNSPTRTSSADALLLSKEMIITTSIVNIPTYTIDSNNFIFSSLDSVGKCIDISNESSQKEAISLVGCVEWLVLRCDTWTMIPVENLISYCRNTCTKLAVFVDTPIDIPGIAFALQLGVDALILANSNNELWDAAEEARKQRFQQSIESCRNDIKVIATGIYEATVTDVCSSGIGDRVCIDLVCLLQEGDGVWIGSCARSLVLVHGETFVNDFVPARPFRINSGAVHSYILMKDGSLKYLCEITAGQEVQVANIKSRMHRGVVVGRVKIEPRPLIKLSFESIGGDGQVFLQQAETVKVCGPTEEAEWRTLAVTEITKGDKIFTRIQSKGTHVGKDIDASVIER
jgi:3-dehydroquinate synthase II